jgi:3-oxoacyl-[acyl-carrier protein] reductase
MNVPDAYGHYLIGRTALVTGAGRGMGQAISMRLASLGAHVVLADIDATALDETARAISHSQDNAQVTTCIFDVADANAVRSAFSQIGQLQVLVNNAGICPLTEVDDISDAEWDRVMAINLKGAFMCSQAALPALRAAGWGRLINISSLAAHVGGIVTGVHYTVSKAGLLAMTKAFARLLMPYGVTANAIAPGPTETSLTAVWSEQIRHSLQSQMSQGHFMQPQEVAEAVAFLCSPLAGSITGATIDINAGMLMR